LQFRQYGRLFQRTAPRAPQGHSWEKTCSMVRGAIPSRRRISVKAQVKREPDLLPAPLVPDRNSFQRAADAGRSPGARSRFFALRWLSISARRVSVSSHALPGGRTADRPVFEGAQRASCSRKFPRYFLAAFSSISVSP
jgi:hypothetical protein